MNTRPKTILIVDDDELSTLAISTIVEALGFEVCVFSDPTQVVEGIQNKTIDLALLDIMMPKVDGYELLQTLRGLPNLTKLPVIMVTAKDTESEMLDGYKSGADYYIRKPFTREQLTTAIHLYLR